VGFIRLLWSSPGAPSSQPAAPHGSETLAAALPASPATFRQSHPGTARRHWRFLLNRCGPGGSCESSSNVSEQLALKQCPELTAQFQTTVDPWQPDLAHAGPALPVPCPFPFHRRSPRFENVVLWAVWSEDIPYHRALSHHCLKLGGAIEVLLQPRAMLAPSRLFTNLPTRSWNPLGRNRLHQINWSGSVTSTIRAGQTEVRTCMSAILNIRSATANSDILSSTREFFLLQCTSSSQSDGHTHQSQTDQHGEQSGQIGSYPVVLSPHQTRGKQQCEQ